MKVSDIIGYLQRTNTDLAETMTAYSLKDYTHDPDFRKTKKQYRKHLEVVAERLHTSNPEKYPASYEALLNVEWDRNIWETIEDVHDEEKAQSGLLSALAASFLMGFVNGLLKGAGKHKIPSDDILRLCFYETLLQDVEENTGAERVWTGVPVEEKK